MIERVELVESEVRHPPRKIERQREPRLSSLSIRLLVTVEESNEEPCSRELGTFCPGVIDDDYDIGIAVPGTPRYASACSGQASRGSSWPERREHARCRTSP